MEIALVLIISAIVVGAFILISQLYRIRLQERRLSWLNSQRYQILRIDVPKNNDKPPLSAEQMFASIHGIYSDKALYQPELSFEIIAKEKFIQFFIRVPQHVADFIEGQIYAQYPTVEIHRVEDYAVQKLVNQKSFAVCDLKTTKPDVYPIKLFSDFEVDPISGITSVMTKLTPEEEVCIQTIIRPVGDEWQDKGNAMIESVRSGKSLGAKGVAKSFGSVLIKFTKMVLNQAIRPGAEINESETKKELPGPVEDALKQIEMKILKLGYEVKIRILAVSPDSMNAKSKAQSIAAAYKQYNTTNLNGFVAGETKVNNQQSLLEFFTRSFESDGYILNIGELASVFHFPHQSVATPNIVWSGAKKGEPPANLPLFDNTPAEILTVIGETNFRNDYYKFGIKEDDRRRHIYVVGKSGVGKSVLLENMAVDDVWKDRGVIIVDPHGEFAEKILSCVPNERVSDVIVFDPADRSYPIAFNLLESVDDDFKGMVASGFVGIFKKIFGNSWGPRLEHILRNTVLALLDYPDSTMLDIPKMLTDGRFRDKVVEFVKDPVIRDFWILEFAQYDSKFRTEAVSPILNKVGQFLATATIRNIVGQPKSKLNIRDIMDNRKIMVVNLSRGKIGEDNSALLGAMMITKIQLAAMSRADVPVDQRPDCYLYVDEFQNFATDSFAVILSEARKYHLNLIIAHQYIAQLPEEVRDAVFGNAGTIVSFRVGGADAEFLVKEFEPVFDSNDLVNLDKYNIYIKLLIDGIASPAFSSKTLPPVEKISGNIEKIIANSRKLYSTDRAVVEEMIMNRSKKEQAELKAEAELFKEGGLEALLVKKKPEMTNDKIIEAKNEPTTITEIHNDQVKPQNNTPQEIQLTAPEVLEKKEGIETVVVPDFTEIKDKLIIDNTIENGEEINKQVTQSKSDEILSNNTAEPAKEKKPRYLKFQNILNGKIYKEQTARGGVKWYIGETIDPEKSAGVGIIIDDNAKKMIELSIKADELLAKDTKSENTRSEKKSKKKKRKDDSKNDSNSKKAISDVPKILSADIKNKDEKTKDDNDIEAQSEQFIVPPATSNTDVTLDEDSSAKNNSNENGAKDIIEGEEIKL